MSTRPLLFELGTEELPPGSLRALAVALHDEVLARLREQRIAHGAARWFATPRRLALLIDAVAARQDDSVVEKLGPYVSAAFDGNGVPTPAALGFARGCGVDVGALERAADNRGERLAHRQRVEGQEVAALLPTLLESALAALPIARRMRWGARRDEFVRPVHWVVLLHGEAVVPGAVLGIATGRETRGHRVLGRARIALATACDYEDALRSHGGVIADYAERRQRIAQQVQATATGLGGTADLDEALLDEVCSLVEWPCALAGRFETRFLEVPPEALVSSMKRHQKYFPVLDAEGKLLAHFITVANIDSTDPARVIAGNERVIRPRLADAAFFYRQDRQTTLAARREKLREIVFQRELGTLWDKTERVARLAGLIGAELGADASLCTRAGQLSKSDLVSEMVLEFDELQGTMGRCYALHDGEHPDVAAALAEQYLPRHAGDPLPGSLVGCALALAERLDTLVGIFGIGQPPSGSKDPFALRRAALGVLRILVERELALDLQALLAHAAAGYHALPRAGSVVDEVRGYVLERFRAWYTDAGVRIECVLAVAARDVTVPLDFDRRVRAVAAFSTLPEAAALAAANKRVANILSRSEEAVPGGPDDALLREPAERALAAALAERSRQAAPLLARGDYESALRVLAQLRAPVDAFFDQVLVMCEDASLRANRLALLGALRAAFLAVADISALAVAA